MALDIEHGALCRIITDRDIATAIDMHIGDEYFDAGQETSFVDLDVLAVGAVVPRVSADFDRYWASDSAYPVDRLLKQPKA